MIRNLLVQVSQKTGLPVTATGTSSVSRYTVMQRGDLLSVYCPTMKPVLAELPDSKSDRFANLKLIEVEEETVYFDAQEEGGFFWASPVQVYLELMVRDKRDQETAEQLKPSIKKAFESISGWFEYTILATTTEQEWQLALKLRKTHSKDPIASEAGRLVAEYFSDLEQLGMIRLQESKYFRPDLQVEDFMSALKELFRYG